MKNQLQWLLLHVALFAFLPLSAQRKNEKWGKISESDLKMTHYTPDSAASAVILQDIGEVALKYQGNAFYTHFKRHRRIKIFDTKALDEGNIRIPYYSYGNAEKIRDIDIQIFFPNGEKQKVKSDQVMTEKINKRLSAKKVFVPNISPGCIIEYRFEMESEFIFALQDWYFQHELPVRWSEVSVTIPQYFNYVFLIRKPRELDLQESEEISEMGAGGVQYPAIKTVYGLAKLPAIKEEPFITTVDDYRAHIGFQLQSVNFPNELPKKIMTDWASLAKEMEDAESFGRKYLKTTHFDKAWDDFSEQLNVKQEPAQKIMEKALLFVTQNVKWNEEFRMYPENDLNDAYQKKSGNSGEINLLLVALLRKAGLNAYPLLLSTREHGEMYPAYPFVEQFNSVLAYIQMGDKQHVVDATSPFFAIGQLQTEHYNGAGWIVDENNPNWVEITAPESSHTWYGRVKLTEDGHMNGDFILSMTGQTAAEWRSALKGTSPAVFLKKHFASDYQDMTVDSIKVKELEACDQALGLEFKCKIPNTANVVNEFIYCRPVLDFLFTENPLKSLKREFPVDLSHPLKANYVLLLELPNGYDVEELPEPDRISLENNGGKISFSCSKSGNRIIQYTLKMNIAQLHFPPEEYLGLRKFFDLAAEKTQLQLVLKKT